MSDVNANEVIEYVIILYSHGKVITIIGIADFSSSLAAFRNSCDANSAQWGYLYKSDGSVLDSFPAGNYLPLK